MTNFDNLYHAVYTASHDAIKTVSISKSLSLELNDVILAAWQKDEFKYLNVTLGDSYDYLPMGKAQCRVYTEKPIAMFNAITVFMGSKNYAEVKEKFPKLDKVLGDAKITLTDHIEGELSNSHAYLKYFVCPKCGERFRLYVFKDPVKNSFVNIKTVAQLIEGTSACWSCEDSVLDAAFNSSSTTGVKLNG